MERIFADLLRDSPYSGHRWHSPRRGGAAAAFHRSPNVAYFIWWGRWKRLATALEYALGYSDPAVVGALVLPWPVGGQAPGERLAVLRADLWGDPMYANPDRKSAKASLEIAALVPAGPVVSLPDMDVALHRGEVDDVGSDSDSSSVPSESSASAVSTASACGSPARPTPPDGPGERPPQFTPGTGPQVVGSGKRRLRSKGAGKTPRIGAAEVDGAGTPRPKRRVIGLGGSYLSSGIMRRARRWAWVMQKPDDLPPRGGILMGLQSGLPAKWLCVPRRGVRARAAVQRQASARGGGGGRLEIRPPWGRSAKPHLPVTSLLVAQC